ncbi:hypothetical protein DOTSEDRAFT_71723 [Dothistroma septosporum NZE10]|uniref:Uncharacterized protein n=1 Tax=Dothistroma septosporum (strain NZE10 / CBS 128990) TaxID=675120 RepID=N1PNK8_DOTSN|nr:hypothetical protein DOTSEDRAFT_71723 [Dothistroma septosporum NZE10]
MVIRYHARMASTPAIKIFFMVTNTTYKRSAGELIQMIVTSTSTSPSTLTLELRGETDSGTVLEDGFRMEHFEFFDVTTSTFVTHDLFPGTCEPREEVYPDGVVELHKSKPLKTVQYMEDMSPLADPMRLLQAGHEYRIRLKPQKESGYAMGKADLFRGREHIPVNELPQAVVVELKSDDEVVLKVEE